MKKRFNKKNILIIIVLLFLLMQSFRIDKRVLPVNPATDFISVTAADTGIADILKTACYDCHSNQPEYPWYTNIAPVSWWIKHHINEGSHHLNFSEWSAYSEKRKNHKLEECVEMIEENKMPMSSYTMMHPEAKLTDTQKLHLVEFFKGLRNSSNQH